MEVKCKSMGGSFALTLTKASAPGSFSGIFTLGNDSWGDGWNISLDVVVQWEE